MSGVGAAPAAGPGRRLASWLGRQAATSGAVVAQVVARVRDAIRRRSTASPDTAVPHEPTDETNDAHDANVEPRWGVLALATAVAAGVFGLRFGLASSLYWYVFPLFGIGIAYVLQFRSELTARWWAVLAISAVLGAVGVARDWPFSGHVLWNVVFLGHAAQSPARRTWIAVLLASLVHLFAMKFAFQRPMDVVGGFISLAVAAAALPIAGRRRGQGSTST